MEKLLKIYKDAFETTFGLFKTDGFKFFASIIALIFLAVTSFIIAGMVTCSGWLFLLSLLGETLLLLPVYVKLCRIIDGY